MKKISLLSLLVLLLFSTFVKAELIHISPNYYEDGIFYDVDWDSHEVSVTYRGISPTEYMDEYRGTVIIPESVFYDDSVYHVVGITSQAFQSCYNLAAVNIPSTVLYIGEEAFAQSGITSLVIPGSVQEIEEGAFYNMQDLLTVRFEEGVPYIPQSAFAISESLRIVHIPASVTEIRRQAFYTCTGLDTVYFASSLPPTIAYDSFDAEECVFQVPCGSKNAYVAALNVDASRVVESCDPAPCLIASGTCGAEGDNLTWELSCDSVLTISGTGAMANYNLGGPWAEYRRMIKSVVLSDELTTIGARAFYECEKLTSISIPNSVTSIGYGSFQSCFGIQSVTIPQNVTSIGTYAFLACSGLTNIVVDAANTVYDSRDNCNAIVETATNTLLFGCTNTSFPSSITSIADYAVSHSYKTYLNIPNTITSIGRRAFDSNRNLYTVIFSNGLTNIGEHAFRDCQRLTTINIPESVTQLGNNPFWICKKLTSITVNENNTYFDSRNNCNAIIETASNKLISGCINTIIPEEVTAIGAYALSYVDITSITIPKNVTVLEEHAFSYCEKLTRLDFMSSIPPTIGMSCFTNVSATFFVPCGSKDAYVAALGVDAERVVEQEGCAPAPCILASGICGAEGDSTNLTWELSCDSVLTISGTGEMAEYSYGNNGISSPWTSYASQIKSIILEEGVTSIGTYAFYNYGDARYNSVKSITIPNSLVKTGFNVFSGITSMEAVYITDLAAWMNIVHSNTYGNPLGVAHHLYVNGVELENLVVPDGTTAIKPSVFIGCKGLKSMQLPGSVQTIGSNAFANCSGLKDVTLPEGLQVVDNSAFYQCDSLETIHVSSTVTRLGNCSFEGCPKLKGVYIVDFAAWCNMTLEYSSPLKQAHHLYLNDVELTEVDIPETCTIIKDYVFEGCSELTAIQMHANITSINHFAFNGCTSLQSVIIPENVTYIGSEAFVGCSGLQQVEFLSTTPPEFFNNWGARIFMGNDATYLVPCGSRDAYVAALNTGDASPYQIDASRIIEHMPFSYSAASADENKGSVSIIQEPACADMTLSFRADAAEGYLFKQWSDGNTDNPRTLTLTQDTALVAEFEANPCFVPVTASVSAEACDSYYWAEADTTIAGSGVYTHTFATVAGCDSIVTLNLTVHESAYASDTMFIVQGDTIRFDINAGMDSLFEQASKNYIDRDTMPTIFGCDSIILHFMYEITVDTVVVSEGDTIDLSDLGVSEETDVTVEPGGEVTVDEDEITIHSLAIVVSGWSSGQVNNPDKRVFHVDDIYIDFRLDPNSETASEDRWYAFSVPFKVNINGGIKNKNSNAPVYGTDYIILEYDGNARANTGRGWHTLNGNMLKPGKFYMFGINGTNCNNWEFHMEVGEDIFAPDTVGVEAYPSSNTQDGGWNGIGNPTLSYSSNPGMAEIAYLLLYDNRIGDYVVVDIDDVTLAVGQPFFIQTGASGTFDFNYEVPASVRRREAQRRNPLMKFSLIRSGETITTGRMYVSLHDDANGRYTVGRDIARMSNSAGLAQIWSEAYGVQLAAHGVQEPESETVVPLGISAPANGEYLLEMGLRAMDEYDVELLCQGAPFATLFADQPLTLNLKAGTTHDYSLRIRRKSPTDLDNLQTDDVQCTKMLIDNKLYIFQGGRIYDAQGQLVK